MGWLLITLGFFLGLGVLAIWNDKVEFEKDKFDSEKLEAKEIRDNQINRDKDAFDRLKAVEDSVKSLESKLSFIQVAKK